MPAVSAGQLVRFRIVPVVPETSGGSFEPAELLKAANGAVQQPVQIARFVEKPNRATAEHLLATGRFPFNRTMVLLKASAILFEIEWLVPDVVSACRAALDPHSAEHECQRLARDAVSACPTMAIDVAVMEKTNRVTVLPLKACWSDGGSWITLWETAYHDDDDVLRDLKIQEASRNCHLRSESRRVVALGVDNLVVVGTDPVVMVSHRDRNYLLSIVSLLESKEARESKAHRKFYRLWGSDDGDTEGERRQVKKVVVNLGANLSLVMHQNRAVHWIVMASKTVLEKDVGQELVSEKQNSYIILGALHRLSNSGKISVEMIKVQSGHSLGDDEIASSEERLAISRMMSFDKQTACICNKQSRFLLRGRNHS
jgi:mannose-1-phosphate guanylyltransferase